MIRKFLNPPVFEKDEDNFRAKFIHGFALTAVVILSLSILTGGFSSERYTTNIVLLVLITIQWLSLYLLRKGKITASGIILVTLGWLGLTFQAYTADGVRDTIIVAYIAMALLASIVINWWTGGVIILASIAAIWGLAFLEVNKLITPEFRSPIEFGRDLTLIFLAITALIYFSTTSLRDAVRRASKSEANLRQSNEELQGLNQNLEQRVSNRTAELELANQRNEKRAKQFEAIAQVARATASNQELQTLLPRLAEVTSEQFGFYHTGIFLLDENREYAVLTAANSEGGKRMLQRGHRLRIGQMGIVGIVAATSAARIALDVGADASYFENPDLPNTRSELALPIRTANDLIGVLDIQSVEGNAFQPEDIEVLSTLADQVAIAIQNARSYEITQELLKQAEKQSGAYIRESWKTLQSQEKRIGYMVTGSTVKQLQKPMSSPPIEEAMSTKRTVVESGKSAVLAIPIQLRNEVIGIINICGSDRHDWDDDEKDIAEAVADRLSLALETSLLIETTQRRAEIERVTSEVSGKISSTTQFEAILRTAAEELSRVLGGSEVYVQLQPDLLETPAEAEQSQIHERNG
jgi:GAF domain-containing protein